MVDLLDMLEVLRFYKRILETGSRFGTFFVTGSGFAHFGGCQLLFAS